MGLVRQPRVREHGDRDVVEDLRLIGIRDVNVLAHVRAIDTEAEICLGRDRRNGVGNEVVHVYGCAGEGRVDHMVGLARTGMVGRIGPSAFPSVSNIYQTRIYTAARACLSVGPCVGRTFRRHSPSYAVPSLVVNGAIEYSSSCGSLCQENNHCSKNGFPEAFTCEHEVV